MSRPMWPTPRRRGRPLIPQLMELIAILVFLFGGYHLAVWAWSRTAPKEVEVPRIVGLRHKEAQALLDSAGLLTEIVAEKLSETDPEGAVTASEPPPGRKVKVGRTVGLTISAGSRWAKMPDVTDMSVDRARALLKQTKLTVRRERARYHPRVPVGYVLAQQPNPGERVPRGAEVDLVISKGPQPRTERIEQRPTPTGRRSVKVDVTVPPGASLQEVRMVVTDQRGEHVAYEGFHEPGEQVAKSVSGEGPEAVVRVYLSGLLVQEKDF